MKGKPLLILALALVIVPADAWAQWRGVRPAAPRRKGDISPFLGYQWGGGINTNLGRIKIEPDFSYGGEINIVARRGGEIVVLDLRQDTEATLTYRVAQPDSTLGGLAVNYFQIGGMGVAPIRGHHGDPHQSGGILRRPDVRVLSANWLKAGRRANPSVPMQSEYRPIKAAFREP